jgi:hypothetical protein
MPEEKNKPRSVACNCSLFWNPTNPSKGQASFIPTWSVLVLFPSRVFLITSYYNYALAYPSLLFQPPTFNMVSQKGDLYDDDSRN